MRRPPSKCASVCHCSSLQVPRQSGHCARLRVRRYESGSWPRSLSLFTRRPPSRSPIGFDSRHRRFARGKRRTERGNRVADGATRVAQLDGLTGSRFVAAYAILILHGAAFGYTLPSWLNLSQAVSYFFVLSG